MILSGWLWFNKCFLLLGGAGGKGSLILSDAGSRTNMDSLWVNPAFV